MATERTADLLLGAFQDEMVTRKKFEVKDSKGKVVTTVYFKPITRYARVRAQQLAGSDDALVISTQLLCQMAEKEDGSFIKEMLKLARCHQNGTHGFTMSQMKYQENLENLNG